VPEDQELVALPARRRSFVQSARCPSRRERGLRLYNPEATLLHPAGDGGVRRRPPAAPLAHPKRARRRAATCLLERLADQHSLGVAASDAVEIAQVTEVGALLVDLGDCASLVESDLSRRGTSALEPVPLTEPHRRASTARLGAPGTEPRSPVSRQAQWWKPARRTPDFVLPVVRGSRLTEASSPDLQRTAMLARPAGRAAPGWGESSLYRPCFGG